MSFENSTKNPTGMRINPWELNANVTINEIGKFHERSPRVRQEIFDQCWTRINGTFVKVLRANSTEISPEVSPVFAR